MSINDLISNVTTNLTEWGVNYRETTEGISVGDIHLEAIEEGYRPIATILDGTELVGMTSDADKAAALLAFPLARREWELGYTGDFNIAVFAGEVETRLSYGSADVSISAGVNEAGRFAVMGHPLFSKDVVMSDLEAVLSSTELAYGAPNEAWQALCASSDTELMGWQEIVEFFNGSVLFTEGDRFTKVESPETEAVALVEDYNPEVPIRVIDVEHTIDTTHWSHSDVAAAVLHAIS
jgi:hypothetical protein|nr:MAG TPA: hypothetical protein [Caudoviricetes sp.]